MWVYQGIVNTKLFFLVGMFARPMLIRQKQFDEFLLKFRMSSQWQDAIKISLYP
jgi:hypothetical protein